MNLEVLAKVYLQSIQLEEEARKESLELAEDLSILRADLHALWMEALREAKIPFSDRTEAADLAYTIAQGKHLTPHR